MADARRSREDIQPQRAKGFQPPRGTLQEMLMRASAAVVNLGSWPEDRASRNRRAGAQALALACAH
jgi:hypothetical protein